MRLKKEKKAPAKKAPPKQEDDDDAQSKDDDGVSVTSSQAQSATTKDTAQTKEVSIHQIGNGNPMGNFVATDSIFDWKSFYDTITKVSSVNNA